MGALVMRRLVGTALAVLDNFEAPGGLQYCRDLLNYEPWITSRVASYLAKLSIQYEDDAFQAMEGILRDRRLLLSPWQHAWMLEIPLTAAHARDSARKLAQGVWKSKVPDAVKARSALVLAEYGDIGMTELGEFYQLAHAASRPDIVSAMAQTASDGDPLLKSIGRDSFLNAQIISAVGED
jgi:hypothetical protein